MGRDPREYGQEWGGKEQGKWDAAYLFQTLLSVVPSKKKSKNSLGSALNTDTGMKYLLLLIKASDRVKPMSLLVLLMHCQAMI